MWYAFHVVGQNVLYCSNERPSDERGLVILEGTRVIEDTGVDLWPIGSERKGPAVLCRLKADPKIHRRFHSDSIPDGYEPSEFSYGAHWSMRLWEDHSKHIKELQDIRSSITSEVDPTP